MPRLTARVRVRLSGSPDAANDGYYAMRGSAAAVSSEIAAFAALGVDHLALSFAERDSEVIARAMERFDREVANQAASRPASRMAWRPGA